MSPPAVGINCFSSFPRRSVRCVSKECSLISSYYFKGKAAQTSSTPVTSVKLSCQKITALTHVKYGVSIALTIPVLRKAASPLRVGPATRAENLSGM